MLFFRLPVLFLFSVFSARINQKKYVNVSFLFESFEGGKVEKRDLRRLKKVANRVSRRFRTKKLDCLICGLAVRKAAYTLLEQYKSTCNTINPSLSLLHFLLTQRTLAQ